MDQADVDEHIETIHDLLEEVFPALDCVTMQFYWHGPGAYRDAPQLQTLWMDAVRYSTQTGGWQLDNLGPFPPVEKDKSPDFISEKDKLRQQAFWQANTNTFITTEARPELKNLIGRRYPGEYIEVLTNQHQWRHLAGSHKPGTQSERQVHAELAKTVKQKKSYAATPAAKSKPKKSGPTLFQERAARRAFDQRRVDQCMGLVDSPRSKPKKHQRKKWVSKPVDSASRPAWNRYW